MFEIDINPQFEQVLSFINQTSSSVFLTGRAGTGKTTLLKYIRDNTYKQMAVCAPTGVAAINAGGTTIHSLFQLPFTPFVPSLNVNGDIDPWAANLSPLKYSAQRLSLIRNLELLVIDEISMVRADLLDQIDVTLRRARRNWQQPFGGVQLLFIGDMHQLPPVVRPEDWQPLSHYYDSPYFFDSHVVKKFPPVYIELQKVYRQRDESFISLLNKVRRNELDTEALTFLNALYRPEIDNDLRAGSITLTTHNRKADEINEKNLEALPGSRHVFSADIKGVFPEGSYPAAAQLELKEGARVMFLKNNSEKNYYNGKIGVVLFLDKHEIIVKCDDDKHGSTHTIVVKREIWQNVSYKVDRATKHIEEDMLGTFEQFPLRPAWAITIHKSQGLTFDKLIIDAAEAFSAGQVYVALSRCRSLSGLVLSSRISGDSLRNDENVLKFASGKKDDKQLAAVLHGAKGSYVKSVMARLFDLSPEAELSSELESQFRTHERKLKELGWGKGVTGAIQELRQVDQKFRKQLEHLAEGSEAPENDQGLQERIGKASGYFRHRIAELIKALKTPELRTESKEAAGEINPLLQELYEKLLERHALLATCENGFNLERHVKAKLQVKVPSVRISILANASNSKLAADIKHPELYRELLMLRDEICNDEHKPIYMVANAKTLSELCERLPETEEQLLQVSGFGKVKVDSYGESFLDLIRSYKLANNLVGGFIPDVRSRKRDRIPKQAGHSLTRQTNTRDMSFELFRQGKNPAEIAKERSLTESTVINHLASFVAKGEIRVEELVAAHKQKAITQAMEDWNKEQGLSSLKSQLPQDISFAEIKVVQSYLEYLGKKDVVA